MKKKLIFVCGPNGVGKSTACRELVKVCPATAYTDSEWTICRNPLLPQNEESVTISRSIMTYMLAEFLSSTLYENIVWSYGFHGYRLENFRRIMADLRQIGVPFDFIPLVLTCGEKENIRRMQNDGRDAARIERALKNTRLIYAACSFPSIDTTSLTISETVEAMKNAIQRSQPFDERELALS